MAMPATHIDWTVKMLDALEDDGRRYEIIDGELFVTPAPIDLHGLVVGELFVRLHAYLKRNGCGRAMGSPSDVRRGDRTRNRVQPDVFVMRLTDGQRPPYPYEQRDLLFAVEVTSPRSMRLDYEIKRDMYLHEGIGEYWVMNHKKRNVSRWRTLGDTEEVLTERVEWHMDGASEPFVLDLVQFYDEALR